MKIKSLITLLLNTIINSLMNYCNKLSNNYNYLFKLELKIYLDKKNNVFIYIIDLLIIFM